MKNLTDWNNEEEAKRAEDNKEQTLIEANTKLLEQLGVYRDHYRMEKLKDKTAKEIFKHLGKALKAARNLEFYGALDVMDGKYHHPCTNPEYDYYQLAAMILHVYGRAKMIAGLTN